MTSKLEIETANERFLETYRSMISNSAGAVKLLALLNGGAAIALMAFVGNTWNSLIRPSVGLPMGLFAFGLFFCGVTGCVSYFTQYAFYNDQRLGRKTQHQFWLLGAIAAAVLSLACFAIGSVCGV